MKALRQQLDLTSWNILVLFALAVLSVCYCGPGPRIGDGAQYYLTLISIAENGSVYTTPETQSIYDEYARLRGRHQGFLKCSEILEEGRLPTSTAERIEFNHFWFYSLLASFFYWPLKWVGEDIGLSFNLLHLALLFVGVYVADRRLGPLAASSLILLVLFSPALWFANKAHTEFFTVIATTIAIIYFIAQPRVGPASGRRYLVSAVWFAVASTQNPPFAILALIALAYALASGDKAKGSLFSIFSFWKRGTATCSEKEKWVTVLLLAAAVVLMAIHPCYYLVTHGTLTPTLLTGHTQFGKSLLPIKEFVALWIDPDLGMFPNWPGGLLILVLFGWLCWTKSRRLCFSITQAENVDVGRRCVMLKHNLLRAPVVVLTVAAILILGWSNTRAGNINHGGTVYISRYCLWFIFLFFPLLWSVVRWLALYCQERVRPLTGRRRPVFWTLATVMLIPGLWSVVQFRPGRPEVFLQPAPFSLLLYEHLPWLYDPLPKVFSERYGHQEDYEGWAVSHPSANKILVWDDTVDLSRPDKAPPVPGHPELDPAAVCRLAGARLARRPGKYYVYLNGLASELKYSPEEP